MHMYFGKSEDADEMQRNLPTTYGLFEKWKNHLGAWLIVLYAYTSNTYNQRQISQKTIYTNY